jgi:glycosyltransferase involved in cell wall biosynthesis
MFDVAISVAVVTRNRPASLERTLASLRAQEAQPFEVIVSDDSDGDNAAETAAVAARYGCTYARGPQRGLYANRNAGALRCGGTHVRTMDDDHEFPVGHWAACQRAVQADPTSIWIIGEIVPSENLMNPDECPGELHPRGFSVPPTDRDRTWAIADGASIYPASLFREDELRFSESFRFGASYLEFGSRLYALGYRIRYLAGTHIVHHADFANRSFMDAEEDLAAKAFATLSHSFSYQPTLANRMLTSAELARDVVRQPRIGIRALRRGLAAYRDQQAVLARRR